MSNDARAKLAQIADTLPKPIPTLNQLRATLDEMQTAQLHPPCIVDKYLYADVGVLVAPGGTGKTTMVIHEMVHIALGRSLWGLEVVSPGKSLLISAEDSREVLLARLWRVIEALELTDEEIEQVRMCVHFWDVAGEDLRLLENDKHIGLSTLPDRIVEAFKGEGIQLVTIDPAVSFGASEQAVNDNEQGLITAARRIMRGLGCCARYIHHTGQNSAREKRDDQYAGRGGTAMADGARMVSVLHPWEPGHGESPPPLCGIRDERDSILMLSRPKLSFCSRQPRIWIRRNGYTFEHFIAPPRLSQEDEMAEQMEQLARFLESQVKAGTYLTKRQIEDGYLGEIGMTKREFQAALARLQASVRVVDVDLPKHLQQGRRQSFLCPTAIAPEIQEAAAQMPNPGAIPA